MALSCRPRLRNEVSCGARRMRFALFTNLGNVMTELAADVPGDAPLLLLRCPPSLLPPKLPLSLLLAAPGT